MAALPQGVELVFSEPVSPVAGGIKVFSPSGRQIAGPATSRRNLLYAPMSSAETGTFVVSWQVLANDTHPSRGAFRFSVGRPGPNPYSSLVTGGEIGTASPLGFVLQALARWVHFVGFALVFGVAGYSALTRVKQRSTRTVRRLVGAGIVCSSPPNRWHSSDSSPAFLSTPTRRSQSSPQDSAASSRCDLRELSWSGRCGQSSRRGRCSASAPRWR
jgi:hypothetical protein